MTMTINRTPFLLVDISYKENPFRTFLRLKGLDGATVILPVTQTKPRFWTEQSVGTPSDFTSITGIPLHEIRVEKPSDIRLESRGIPDTYCADVPWASLVRWIHGWGSVIEVNRKALDVGEATPIHIHDSKVHPDEFNLDVMWFDIETEDSLDTKETPGRIVSIALLRPDGTHEIGTTAPTSPRQVKRFMQSQEALEGIVEHTQPIPPVVGDVLVENFDAIDPDEREAALLWWFKTRLEQIDPDVIAGQNIKDYDIPYILNRCRNQRRAMSSKHSGNVPVFNQYPEINLRYRQQFDSKFAYAEQVQGAGATTGRASLAWMASEELGYGKVPRNRICDLMAKDPMMLAVYNAWDNVVAERVCTKLDLVKFYQIKTAFHNSCLSRAHSNMMLCEDMMGVLLMKEKKVMPDLTLVRERTSGIIEAGGHVAESPTGVWRNAFELDNSMEYPSAMIVGNLSPDTKINPAEFPDGYPWPVTVCPSGRVYRRDFEGVMPRVLRLLAEGRTETQKQMSEATDPKLKSTLNMNQRVMKENMNSWYGVLGSGGTAKTKRRPFRLAEPGIGSDITEIARIHNEWNKVWLNNASLTFTKDGIEPDGNWDHVGLRLNFEVLYQDTDSCKVAISNHDEAEEKIRPFTEEDVIQMATLLCIGLNETYDDFVKATLGVSKNEFFRVKPDAYYARYFSWGVKKRYAYRLFDGSEGFRGVELRRSSTPEIVKRAQRRVFDAILGGCDTTELNTHLRAIHAEVVEGDLPGINYGTPMGVKKAGTQQHKAAMWSNKHLDTDFDLGDKPVIYIATSTPGGLPTNKIIALEYGESPEDHGVVVDKQASFLKHFANSASWTAILNAFNTSWKTALAGMTHASFDEWFKK
jgi:DNA polymerase elongation subunit (family B)